MPVSEFFKFETHWGLVWQSRSIKTVSLAFQPNRLKTAVDAWVNKMELHMGSPIALVREPLFSEEVPIWESASQPIGQLTGEWYLEPVINLRTVFNYWDLVSLAWPRWEDLAPQPVDSGRPDRLRTRLCGELSTSFHQVLDKSQSPFEKIGLDAYTPLGSANATDEDGAAAQTKSQKARS